MDSPAPKSNAEQTTPQNLQENFDSTVNPKPTRESKRDVWDKIKLIAEFIGLGFLIAYTIYTARIYRANRNAADAARQTLIEIQKQTTAQRQELVGTFAAVIPKESPGPQTIPNDAQLLKYMGLSLTFRNIGKVKAKDFASEATMVRESIPGYQPKGTPQRRQISKSELRPYEQNGPYGMADAAYMKFDASTFTDSDIMQLHDLSETVEISGNFHYDNGFGDQIQESFCFVYAKFQHTFRNGAGANSEGWFPCDEAKEIIKQALKWKRNTN